MFSFVSKQFDEDEKDMGFQRPVGGSMDTVGGNEEDDEKEEKEDEDEEDERKSVLKTFTPDAVSSQTEISVGTEEQRVKSESNQPH